VQVELETVQVRPDHGENASQTQKERRRNARTTFATPEDETKKRAFDL
jgi:hypothetical protein